MSQFTDTLNTRFGGLLHAGSHAPNGIACALEVVSVAKGLAWTDNPFKVGFPDLRYLNDAVWSSDVIRTQNLVPVVEAFWDWALWSQEQRVMVMRRITKRTIREILPIALRAVGLNTEAEYCSQEGTKEAAERAAEAAGAAAVMAAEAARAARAAEAAWAAAVMAAEAAEAAWASWAAVVARETAEVAMGDSILTLACRIWTEEAIR